MSRSRSEAPEPDATGIVVKPFEHVAVIGAGSWGTALATTAAHAGRKVTIFGRRQDVVDDINDRHLNSAYLGDIPLHPNLKATTSLADAVASAELVLLVTPSTTVRTVARDLNKTLSPGVPVFVCAKGIEMETGLLMTEVAKQELPGRSLGAISGPTFADETAKGLPTAVTVAAEFDPPTNGRSDSILSARVAVSLGTETFRPFISDDVVGVEIGGAVKNVLAILCGIVSGAGFASNTRAALITRGLDEMKNLAEAAGGRRETVTGLAGIGDLILTCSSLQSRNLRFGTELGARVPRDEIFGGKPVVVEGVANAASVMALARTLGVEMPIVQAVNAMVNEDADIAETFARLWTMPLQAEPRAIDIEVPHPVGAEGTQRLAELMSG